jgi:uncharacterized protein
MEYSSALVTGASSGLGKALCHLLASKGIALIITGRDLLQLQKLEQTLPSVPILSLAADLSDPSGRQTLRALIRERAPDLIINNAGFGLYGEALNHSLKEQLDILEVNGAALLELTLEGAKAMRDRKKRGTILNVSSAASFFPFPNFSVYAASKAFVTTLSQGLDVEFAPYGVRVLTSCPGQIITSFRSRAAKGFPQRRDHLSMTAQKAAKLIWKQIEKQKHLQIIDWRTHLLIWVARYLLCEKIRSVLLKKTISSRYPSDS